MRPRQYAVIAGISYLVIFAAAVFANFLVLESILSDPVAAVTQNGVQVRLGAFAFLVAAVFDLFVAWALYELYGRHALSGVSACFRVIHAALMGLAVFALPPVLGMTDPGAILEQVGTFNMIWLIGLLFFGVHLLLLSLIVKHIRIIPFFLALAGFMYIVDTGAHLLLADYEAYADLLLALVAVPAILGEMSFSVWLLAKGGKEPSPDHG